MKAAAQAWLDKAELSYEFAQQCMKPPFSYYSGVCLHSQFGAEQYLNACLREAGIPFLVLQELPVLLDTLLALDPSWNQLQPLVNALMPQESEFGGFGYPGVKVNQDNAIESLESCRQVREIVQSALLSPDESHLINR